MQTLKRTLALIAALITFLGTQLSALADFSGDLKGLNKNSSTNWGPSSPWSGGNLQGWQELDYVVVRAELAGGPQTNQKVDLVFPKFKTDAPGFQNLYFISNSPNTFIISNVLNAPPAPADWSYNLRVTVTDSQPAYIYFYARLAAGSHINVGSSLQLSGEPSFSPLQIHKPDTGPGSPDLAIKKTGPAIASPGDIITYTITYTNKATNALNAANGVQLTDQLPSLVSFVSASNGGTNEAGILTWDLPDLTNRASGFVTYQVMVSSNAANGQMFTNNALILSSEDDANGLDNRSSVKTTVQANRPPVANPDAYTINEDTILNVAAPGILANDTDPEVGTVLRAILDTTTSNGNLVLSTNGSFVYTPNLNFNGVDQFTYHASDGSNRSSTVTVTIAVDPTNDSPVALNDAYSTLEDTTLNIAAPGVLANDSDVDGDPLSAVLVSDVSHGVLALNSDGSFTYIPSADFNGVDTFVYRATDGLLSSNATVTITVIPTNDAPVALNDAYTINEDTTLTVSAPGVLANDSDVDGDMLGAVLVSNPAHGSLTLNANGSFQYVPDANFNGTDSFTYRASDGSLVSSTATVTITINPTNDSPVALNDAYTTPEDTALNIVAPGLLANDSDVDGNPLTSVLVTDVSHGTLNLNANGAFTYTPSLNYTGVDTFVYRATDGVLSSNATVTITITPVNDSPVAVNDSYTTPEDTTLNIPAAGVLANDSDVDGDTLTSVIVTGVSHGTLNLNPNGSFSYTPSLNYTGVDTFVYRATDGALSSNATVTITITPLNDSPVALIDAYTTPEDTTLNIAAAGVLSNDSDLDGDPLTSVLVTDVAHGTLNLNANGSFTYTPSLNYTGVDTFVYRATDGVLSSNATVTITITPVNDSPVAVDDSYTTPEDTTLIIPAAGVLANDSDVDGQPLSSILITDVSHGTLNLNANGSFTYTPSLNYTGVDTFVYRATDGALSSNATVTITITPLNDSPVALNDVYTTPEDTTLNIAAAGVLANDSDLDGDPLTSVLVTDVAHGALNLNANGSFTYTPSLNYTGVDTFVYRATDGLLSSNATVMITITPVNDSPVAVNDNYMTPEDTTLNIPAAGVLANDSDVDGQPLSSILITDVSHGTLNLNANGSFTYTPSLNYTGVDTFVYRATDGALSSNATVIITVTPLNDSPVAVNDNFTTPEDTTLTVAAPGVLANDIDTDGDPLTSVLVSDVSHGTLALNANGSFTYTPSLNYTGVDTFVYRATDGVLSSNATVTIIVTPLNDSPVAVNDAYTTPEDTTLNVAAAGVLANDSDVDGDPLISVLVTTVSHGTLNLNANGSFTYTPSLNYTGVDTFVYRATDGVLSSNATVTITVTPVNDRPVPGAAGDSYTVLEDQTLTVTAPGVLANDTDVDGDPLSAVRVSGPSHGTLALNANGSFVYQPETNYFGSDSFVYVANDGQTNSIAATVNIQVLPVNDAPTFTRGGDQDCNQTATAQTIPGWASNISVGPANEAGQTVNFIVSNDNNTLFTVQPTIAPDGTLTYTTASGVYGTANVHVSLHDNGGTANGGSDTSSEVVFHIMLNSPPSVSIVTPVNGAGLLYPAIFSVIASANDPDGTVTNVQVLINGSLYTNLSTAPFYFVLSNLATGFYQFSAIASDNCGASTTSSPVTLEIITNAIVATGPILQNFSNGLYDHYVTISNRTSETWVNGFKLFVKDLPATNRVWNATGTNAGVPFIEKTNAVPPGGTAQVLVQYYVPNPRTTPKPTLVAVPNPYPHPLFPPVITKITRAGSTNNVNFTTHAERFYFLEYTEDFTHWTTDPQAHAGTGGILVAPQTNVGGKRFYRVLLIP